MLLELSPATPPAYVGTDWPDAQIDPYLVWAGLTGFKDLRRWDSKERFAVLIELRDGLTARQFALAVRQQYPGGQVEVSDLYALPAKGLERTRFCTAKIGVPVLTKEVGDPASFLRTWVQRFELSQSLLPPEHANQPLPTPPPPESAPDKSATAPVVVGVIDDGLAFAHRRFRGGDGKSTRIRYLWDQNPGSVPRDASAAPGVGYGRELTAGEIDDLLRRAASSDGVIDEDRVYREVAHPGVGRRYSHGTHVMDLACGLDPEQVQASSPRMVCVQPQLPSSKTRDTSGRWLGVHMLDGLRYIIDRADRIAAAESHQPCGPVVVNMSYGNIAGPHDGSSILERAIDELIAQRTAFASGRPGENSALAVVIPAGNHHLARCHASFELAAGRQQPLHWRVLPDDATPSFLEIWLPPRDRHPDVAVQVTTPWGDASGWITKRQIHTWTRGADVVGTIIFLERAATGDGTMILIALAPTVTFDPGRTVPPAGTWEIRVENRGASPVEVDAWVQRDETAFGYARRGRQSRFEDPHYARFDAYTRLKEKDDEAPYAPKTEGDRKAYVKRENTLSAIATGEHTLIVGGYRESDGDPARYTPRGRTSIGTRAGPDAMAVSERSVTRHGVRAAGTRSNAVVAGRGTSVAAPQVARWTAAQFAAGSTAATDERAKLKADAEKHEREREQRPVDPHHPKYASRPAPERGGAGRLDRGKLVPPLRIPNEPDTWPANGPGRPRQR